ncbi:MAG TPA: VacJ family lipoprotein [Stellaceae bacterium]|nr:VacJ family lipoprotein [Stellaceae bacterium]
MRVPRLPLVLPVLLAAGFAISGCAAPAAPGTAQAAAAEEGFNDPLEDTNRAIFSFNQGVDRAIIVPVAKAYRTVLPPPVRDALHNFLQNLDAPVVFANDVLQGQIGLAGKTLSRIVINTTAGVGGLVDVAAVVGIPYHPNDLGVTLATWGFAEGPYIVIPILGPSSARDLAGEIGDSFADPGDYVASQHHLLWVAVVRTATSGIDVRSRNIESLADIEKTALDYYATIRSLYRQRRQAEIRHENSNLPNPTSMQGSDSGPPPFMSYSPAKAPQASGGPTK